MKHLCLLFTFLIYSILLKAQFYNAQWNLGPAPSILDFRDGISTYNLSYTFNTTFTSADICDSAGNLLFITNGINVYDRNGDSLLNGHGLSPCAYTTAYAGDGLNISQAALFLPRPG